MLGNSAGARIGRGARIGENGQGTLFNELLDVSEMFAFIWSTVKRNRESEKQRKREMKREYKRQTSASAR